MPRAVPLWTNAVDALPFTSPRKDCYLEEQACSSSLRLSDILPASAGEKSAECWTNVLLSNYLTDFAWLLQAVPALARVSERIVILSGTKGTASVDAVPSGSVAKSVDGEVTRRYVRSPKQPGNANPILSAARAAGLSTSDEDDGTVVVLEPPLPSVYGTYHTKMLVAINSLGVRVAVFTANFTHADWNHKAQGIFMQDFPRKSAPAKGVVDATTPRGEEFKLQLRAYLQACGLATLRKRDSTVGLFSQESFLDDFDFSTARVSLIGSVPGTFRGARANMYGINRLSAALKRVCREAPVTRSITLSWQYSSQGTLNDPFNSRMVTSMTPTTCRGAVDVRVIYPTEEEVRNSLEGWRGGLALPVHVRSCHPFVNARLHKWGPHQIVEGAVEKRRRVDTGSDTAREVITLAGHSGVSGGESAADAVTARSARLLWRYALPHMKSYAALTRSGETVLADGVLWLLLTSANMSQAAWGTEKGGDKERQLFIRSYELGVLFDTDSSVLVTPDGTPVSGSGPSDSISWYTVTPSVPIALPTEANSKHLFSLNFTAEVAAANTGDSSGDPLIFMPFDLANPAPYASTEALRLTERASASTSTPSAIRSDDIPWVIDIPHKGTDSLGKTTANALQDASLRGVAAWFVPVRQFN